MKKLVIFLLFMGFATSAFAKENKEDSYGVYKKFFDKEGIAWEIDSDEDLTFRYQGGNFFISKSVREPRYLQLNMPNIYNVQEGEEFKVLRALNAINTGTKAVKGSLMNIDTTNPRVWLTIEMFLDEDPELGDFFYRLLDLLHGARHEFAAQLN